MLGSVTISWTRNIETINKKLQKERTKTTTTRTRKYLTRVHKRNKAFRVLLDIISSNDVPGLPRLLSTAKKEGWGTSKIISKTSLAIQGKYHPRNYTSLAIDVDLATPIYELGGGAALHALNKAPISLLTRHTIAPTRQQLSLRITVGDVKLLDIMKNIEMLFKTVNVGELGRVLITLSQDEVAGDGRPCYLDETDEIAGLCEHAHNELDSFKMGRDLTSVKAVVKAVRDGRVHVAKEFSVAAFARHSDSNYGAKPVLLMPTCKHGSWEIAALNLQRAWVSQRD
ncbi:hypothetical protein R3P38DRAFT_2778574 [Favolaschia claudopus]|uniref:Uncharacterized protein n=1 Tax=Favolaschia claudopus TaxID=2862362 RepID=A0AAW0BIE6_9AGAR